MQASKWRRPTYPVASLLLLALAQPSLAGPHHTTVVCIYLLWLKRARFVANRAFVESTE